ncbi:TetR/AcrR family transcriptional regulator [Kribbella capetownensis]|uniref:TetR/AcrR family transcriptional regulator n=1 Tax=Kribbella capetownensis TaxID=1572659 RepID=A0A4R0JE35_9ACTN|nr:TetR/AcrR family transcriptional regulator [Kribbella capetownensis]TCC45031.1 TetR/AcrR family transcriptional regulator [Kribbella capetownensis]
MSETRPGKRERLVAAAAEMVYRQGVAPTTLAHIAEAADVPLGNVYYYFKTKEDIVAAVGQARAERLEATLAELETRHRTPKTRLKALVDMLADRADETALYGCPYGTLATELSKRPDGTNPLATYLMELLISWAERQFQQLVRRDARDLAIDLVAAYEGAAVLASTLAQPDLMARHSRRLRAWIDAQPGLATA